MFCECGGLASLKYNYKEVWVYREVIYYLFIQKQSWSGVEHRLAVSEVMTTTYSFRLRLKYYCVNTHFSPLYHSSKPCQACRCNIQTGLNTL